MLFNSSTFLLFFALVYGSFLLIRRHLAARNALLLGASLVFYGWWDWRFLGLLLFSLTMDWAIGMGLESQVSAVKRRRMLVLSVVSNLGILGFFKYFGFFTDSFAQLARTFGFNPSPIDLGIILPMGISFYTFQSLSYTIDVYRRELPACRSWSDFALFVTFFPQLVAGPIERATALLPQVTSLRPITRQGIHAALWLVAWGYFKKTVVADNLSPIADAAFDPESGAAGLDMWVGAIAFAFQIYADFSGYSDIARGLAKLMGFELMVNFRCPFFAANPSDFWRRWHISLSTWLRDYLYIALGGNRLGRMRTYANLVITMALGGLWHGARWNFLIWGLFHGGLLAFHRAATGGRDDRPQGRSWPALLASIAAMSFLTLVGWILFRCQDASHIADVLARCVSGDGRTDLAAAGTLAWCAAPIIAMDLLHQATGDLLAPRRWHPLVQMAALGTLLALIGVFGVRETREFIYFQF